MIQIPRIVHWTEICDGGRSTQRKLMKIQFAEKDGAGLLQSQDDFSVLGRHAVLEYATRSSGSDAGCIDVVFQPDWNSVQWAAPLATLLLGFHFLGRCKRLLSRDCDNRIDRFVVFVDSRQTRFCQING